MFDDHLKDLKQRLAKLAENRQLDRFLRTSLELPSRRWVQKFRSGEMQNPRIKTLEVLTEKLDEWDESKINRGSDKRK